MKINKIIDKPNKLITGTFPDEFRVVRMKNDETEQYYYALQVFLNSDWTFVVEKEGENPKCFHTQKECEQYAMYIMEKTHYFKNKFEAQLKKL